MNEEVPKEKLDRILNNYTLASTGLGLIPVPAADIAGLMAVQLSMLKEIADLYKVPFLKEAVKKVLTSLIGGFFLTNTMPFLASTLKFVPVLGQTIGMATMPAACGASTYATGKVFIRHFESGGTFLTFAPEKVKQYYAEMLKQGKKQAAKLKDREN
ncbi:DUF697 domain-containing protein [Desulfobacterales bacterium HSG17]|nr:DUF697 domain-containing protein [Desulfobacterales bacterium HSG17]